MKRGPPAPPLRGWVSGTAPGIWLEGPSAEGLARCAGSWLWGDGWRWGAMVVCSWLGGRDLVDDLVGFLCEELVAFG